MFLLRTKVMALVIATAAALLSTLTPTTEARPYTYRQYYGGWHRHNSYNYSYRSYYYKPNADYVGYRHHYVMYYPQRRNHYYFYNPYQRQYWGRCPIKVEGKGYYSLLAEGDRKGNIEDIPEKAFPEPGKLPPMPESTDGQTLDLPPDDLPPGTNDGTPALKEEKKP